MAEYGSPIAAPRPRTPHTPLLQRILLRPLGVEERTLLMIQLPRFAQLRPRERLLAVGSGVVLLIVLLDRLVLSPWSRHAHTVRQEIHDMERALQTHQRLLARKERVFEELKRYQQYLQPPIADELQVAEIGRAHV